MRPTLSLGISNDRVSTVLATRTRLLWYASRERDAGIALADTIAKLVADCPRRSFQSRAIVVALGHSTIRVKPVRGLPAQQDKSILASIVAESPERLFVGEEGELATSRVHVDGRSCAWVAAVRRSLLAEIDEACAACGFRLSHVIPAAVAFGRATEASALVWTDGGVRIEAEYEGGEVVSLRSRRYEGTIAPDFSVVEALRDAGSEGATIADAFGAGKVAHHHALAIRPQPDPAASLRWRRRVIPAAAACLTVCAVAAIMPMLVETIVAQQDRRFLAHVRTSVEAAQARYDSLSLITRELTQAASFVAQHPSSTLLLSEIARALPDSCAVQQLSIDSVGAAMLTAVGPRADAILEGLQHVPDISALRVTGPIEADKSTTNPEERVTASFTLDEGRSAR